METTKPLLWYEGLFLAQQHLQWTDAYHTSRLQAALRAGPHSWGVRKLQLSEAALRNLTFHVEAAQLVFRDGTQADHPGNAVVLPRSFKNVWRPGDKPLRVFAGVRRLQRAGGNVVQAEGTTPPASVDARYVVLGEEALPDLQGNSAVVTARCLTLVVQLFWESELGSVPEYECIPLAEVDGVGGVPALVPGYVPPSMELAAAPQLVRTLGWLHDDLAGRVRSMDGFRNPRHLHALESERGMLIGMLAYLVLNRALPGLRHLREEGHLHPLHAYAFLRQLAGELRTLSASADAGSFEDEVLAAAYDHQAIGPRFAALASLIVTLLDEISLGANRIARFEGDGKLFRAQLPPDFFGPGRRYYLVVRTDGDSPLVAERFLAGAKLAVPTRVAVLAAQALPGVPLAWFPEPPHGASRHGNPIYFGVDRQAAEWLSIEEGRMAALFLADATPCSAFELISLGEGHASIQLFP